VEQYIHLDGAEQVQGAGRMISAAAAEMRRAAESFDASLQRHSQWMEEWLQRYQETVQGEK